jgi:hypothetical protein
VGVPAASPGGEDLAADAVVAARQGDVAGDLLSMAQDRQAAWSPFGSAPARSRGLLPGGDPKCQPSPSVPYVPAAPPCQRFARTCATRNRAPPHNPTRDSVSHLRRCVGTSGTARHCELPEHRW